MATFTPLRGKSYCDIDEGSFSNTIDKKIATHVGFRRYKDCIMEWTWDLSVEVNHFDIHSNNYDFSHDNYIHSILAKINGSWTSIWKGTLKLDNGQWTSIHGANCQDCTGIRIGVHHGDASMAYINEVRVDYTTICTEGDTTCNGFDLYQCINNNWVLIEKKSPSCGWECDNGNTKCIGQDLYECMNNNWVLIEKKSPSCGWECDNGDTKCIGPDLYECMNNKWVIKEKNSPACGVECSPDGIRECSGYDLFECKGGKWMLEEKNSPTCGWTPPKCKDYLNQIDCENNTCYWCDGACQDTPCGNGEIDYLPYIIVGAGGILLLIALLSKRQ